MRTYFIYFTVLAYFAVRIQAESLWIGNCTHEMAFKSHVECMRRFYQSFRQNPGTNCTIQAFKKEICSRNFTNVCRGMAPVNETMIDMLMNTQIHQLGSFTRKVMQINCLNVGGVDQELRPLGGPVINETKGVCNKSSMMYWGQSLEFRKANNKCYQKMQKLWEKNRGDPGLCREFVNVKRCTKEAAYKGCAPTGKAKATLDQALGDTNPYCESGRDPETSRADKPPAISTILSVLTMAVAMLKTS